MSQPPTAIPTVDVQEAAARTGRATGGGGAGRGGAGGAAPAEPLIVDVREADEFATLRLDGVVLLPMSVFADRHEELPKDRPLLMMCAGGGRSAAATTFLLRNGWSDVANVAGGIIAWERAGLPVRRGPLAPGEGDL